MTSAPGAATRPLGSATMTEIPAGWYPDPAPAAPGGVPRQRYWDGERWTEHVQAAPPTQAGPPPYAGTYGQPGHPGQPGQPGQVAYRQASRTTTPDGERLAGWWHRALAYVIDWLVVSLVSVVLAYPFASKVFHVYLDFFDRSIRAAENGSATPSRGDLISQIAGPLIAYSAIALAVQFVYNVGFLKALAATPGKIAVGLRVRLRERPGPLSWATVLKRWAGEFGPGLLTLIPLVGTAGSLYRLLDLLWPAWDNRKQALHDKVARTNVVVRRRS